MLASRIETHGSSMARNRWMSATVTDRRVRNGRTGRHRAGTAAARIAITLVATLLMVACVGVSPEVTIDDPVLVEGRDIYSRNCASCHGASGNGGVGRALSGGAVVENYPDIADQIDLVASGKGTMPAYVDRLSGAEIEAVVRYTREVL